MADDEETLQIIEEQIVTDLQMSSESGNRLFVLAPEVRPVVAEICRGCG